MAALGSQSIASSYEQLLHVDRDGGGNSTTHVAIKDGDNGTTFGFTIATDALMMSSTNRLEFGDTGTYIHQSADGVLDLVSDTEIEINATTIDMNGALDLSGNAQLSGTVTVGADGSGTDVIFYSGTAGDNFTWDASEEKLTITGTNGQTALDVADGNVSITDDLSVDGTANLDAVDIDGNVQLDGTFTVGTDGSGQDVTFYSGTSGDSFVWDSSEEKLTITGTNGQTALDIADGNLVVADNIDLEGDIDVNGSANLDAVDIDGAVQIDNTVTVGADDQGYDVIFYGDTASSNMTWDTSGDDLILNDARLFIDQDDNDYALYSEAQNTTSSAFEVISDALTTGKIAQFYSNSSDTNTRSLVRVFNDNASATGATALEVRQDAAQKSVFIDQGGDGIGIDIDTEATTKAAIRVIDPKTTTGKAVQIQECDGLTTGNALYVHSNSSATNTRNLVEVVNDNTAATGTRAFFVQNDSEGYAGRFDNTNTTNSRGVHIVAGNDANDYSLLAQSRAQGQENFEVFGSGAVRAKNNPAFLAQPASDQTNFAEDTLVTVAFGTERFDQGSNFASNTFTAPVTGKYQLNVSIYLQEVQIQYNYYEVQLKTSNRTYFAIFDAASFDQTVTFYTVDLSVLADMDASDTAHIEIKADGTGGDASHDIGTGSHFSGYLAC